MLTRANASKSINNCQPKSAPDSEASEIAVVSSLVHSAIGHGRHLGKPGNTVETGCMRRELLIIIDAFALLCSPKRFTSKYRQRWFAMSSVSTVCEPYRTFCTKSISTNFIRNNLDPIN
jgi:hypothetical protein